MKCACCGKPYRPGPFGLGQYPTCSCQTQEVCEHCLRCVDHCKCKKSAPQTQQSNEPKSIRGWVGGG